MEAVEEPALPETDVSSKINKPEDTHTHSQESTHSSTAHPVLPSHSHLHNPKSPATPSISKDSIDENMGMDFEEISEDELEETARMKGLVDALGVDWASLVAESKPPHKQITSAKRRWESHNVLINAGISVELLGKQYAMKIFQEHAEALLKPANDDESTVNPTTEEVKESSENTTIKKEKENESIEVETSDETQTAQTNGVAGHVDVKIEPEEQVNSSIDTTATASDEKSAESKPVEVIIPHPVAALQVVMRERAALRKSLFTSAGPYSRALSARRDLAIRRNLCKLPIKDTYVEPAKSYDAELFKSACQLFLQRCA